jgi:ATP synthase protein I
MSGNETPEDEAAALRARMNALSRGIKASRPSVAPPGSGPPPSADSTGAAMSMGLRAGGEFVAAIVLGGAIGWGLDKLIGTKPAFTILFFLLGVAAGVWNVIRATSPKPR